MTAHLWTLGWIAFTLLVVIGLVALGGLLGATLLSQGAVYSL